MEGRAYATLVDTAEVASHLGDGSFRLLEVDEDTTAFAGGHIRGASGVDWKDDLQDRVRRDFIGPQAFAALMARFGIGNESEVVLYGGNNNWFAAYAYWYFKYYGHDRVRLMDGGRKKWQLEGREMTSEETRSTTTTGYLTAGLRDEIRALRGYVELAVLATPGFGLVAVLSPAEARGDEGRTAGGGPAQILSRIHPS